MVSDILKICFENINEVFFIENRTNYRQMILNGIQRNTVIIHHGGFYSPLKGELFRKLFENAHREIKFYFWGDIDLGGFNMYDRLKQNIVLSLMPYRMDKQSFLAGKHLGEKRNHEYLHKIMKYQKQCNHHMFDEVIQCILAAEVTVEQECLL